jgi:hypothetical protein
MDDGELVVQPLVKKIMLKQIAAKTDCNSFDQLDQ